MVTLKNPIIRIYQVDHWCTFKHTIVGNTTNLNRISKIEFQAERPPVLRKSTKVAIGNHKNRKSNRILYIVVDMLETIKYQFKTRLTVEFVEHEYYTSLIRRKVRA